MPEWRGFSHGGETVHRTVAKAPPFKSRHTNTDTKKKKDIERCSSSFWSELS